MRKTTWAYLRRYRYLPRGRAAPSEVCFLRLDSSDTSALGLGRYQGCRPEATLLSARILCVCLR